MDTSDFTDSDEEIDSPSTSSLDHTPNTLSIPSTSRNIDYNNITSIIRSSNRNTKRRKRKTLTGRIEKRRNNTNIHTARLNQNVKFSINYKSAKEKNLSNLKSHYAGLLHKQCPHCKSLHFDTEITRHKFMSCCQNGKVSIAPTKFPVELQNLFLGNNTQNTNFRENIRQYNSAMSFASFGANIQLPKGYGPYHFKIVGDIHHKISSLYAEHKNDARYSQLYILDMKEANEIRLSISQNSHLKNETLIQLNHILNAVNPFIKLYKQMHVKYEEYNKHSKPIDFTLRFIHASSEDSRRYNNPSVSEIAGIFQTNDGAPPSYRDIQIYPNQGGLQSITYNNQNLDALTYALIWPYGEPGWHYEMRHTGTRQTRVRHNLTLREYVSYNMAIRGQLYTGNFNPIINFGKLTQQLMVDYYCRIEGDRLKFIRNQQSKLRVETYVGLADAIALRSEQQALKVGKMVILPSTYIGSPRNMAQNYQDAMAIVRKFGKPDLFITFTCNSSWPEIQQCLHPHETANNRPDLIIRVFNIKINELLHIITKKHVFGHVLAYIYTIEFQKRGLPHMHLLLTLESSEKIRSITDIDSIISAEIPNSEHDAVLHNLVKKHMIHGPCGDVNPNCVCMRDNKCTKHFPKEFLHTTIENNNGYPLYRRRNDGVIIQKNIGKISIIIDNRHVVPYNPFLLKYFECHINVELCCTVKSIKYIHKYIYKGHDCINLAIIKDHSQNNDQSQNQTTTINYDEVRTYLNNRYVGPTEAVHRILSHKMHDQSHDVIRLPVHLEFQQNIYFTEDKEAEALRLAEIRHSKLTAWFELNKSNNPSPYTYPETPKHYVWNNNKWHKRKLGFEKIIGRLYNVSPSDSEKYFLRLLLNHTIGAKNFEDIRTFEGQIYPTFKQTAIKRQLVIDDEEWHKCLSEASTFQMPTQMRELFAYICVFQNPINILHLWNTFKASLSEDYVHSKYSEEIAYQLALQNISETISSHGQNISTFDLPPLQTINISVIPTITDTTNPLVKSCNKEQLNIIQDIMQAIETPESDKNAFFIDGPGGTGKTYLYKCLIEECRIKGYEIIAVAWTGIAATLLPDGRTVHSTFKLPIQMDENSTSSMKMHSPQANKIKITKLIIWDEASMASANALMCINRLLQDIMCNKNLFGNKVIVLGGDFRQTLPVVPRGSRHATITSCIKFSPIWQYFQIKKLTKNMRVHDDAQQFSDFLLQIGNGEYPTIPNSDNIQIPDHLIEKNDIIFSTFHDVKSIDLTKQAILAPKNEHCREINDKIIDMLPGVSKQFLSIDSIVTDDPLQTLQYPIEFINTIEVSGLPPHILNLKIGTIVMLIRNMNITMGFMNGTRCKLLEIHRNTLTLKIIDGKGKNKIMILPRIDLTSQEDILPFQIKRRQFPIRIAFAITINKAQGQTFEKIGIYLPEPVFSHGQLYVAMSRVRNFNQLKIKCKDNINSITNIVYKEIIN